MTNIPQNPVIMVAQATTLIALLSVKLVILTIVVTELLLVFQAMRLVHLITQTVLQNVRLGLVILDIQNQEALV